MKFIKKIKLSDHLKKNGNFSLTVILVIGILIALNFISYQMFVRFDLTENKDYSISKVSRKTVSKLDDVVNIKVYFSKNLPPKFRNLEQEIKDILDEYKNYSGGNVEVAFIDPSSFEDPLNELTQKGIAPLQFNVMRNDSYEVVQGFMGMVIQYGDQREVVPMIDSSRNLEYTVTTAIKKLTSESMMTVGLLSSHGVIDAGTHARKFYKGLEDLYKVEEIDLKAEDVVMDNIDTLVMFGPREPFEEAELEKIDAFVMSGRPLIVLMDGVLIDPRTGPYRNKIGFDSLLNKYGVKLNKNLIADVSNSMVSIPTGLFNVNINYALWPKVVKKNFDQDNAVVSSLESLTLPWVSSIDIVEENIDKDKVDISIMARSTKDACAQNATFNIDPQAKTTDCEDTRQYDLAVSLAGELKSAFEEGRSAEAKVMVVADSDFPTDQFYNQSSDNVTFLQNMVDSVTLDEDLINIRSQGVTERPIKKLDKTTKNIIRYANIFGMTVLVLAFGLLRYFLRRRNK